jgi:hypothetical protein
MVDMKKMIAMIALTGFGVFDLQAENASKSSTFKLQHTWPAPEGRDLKKEPRFGSSGMLVDGDVIAIATDRGADGSFAPGKVRMYSRENPGAPPEEVLMAPERNWPDGFGFALAGSENRLLIGAPDDSEINWGAGRAWLYRASEEGWDIEHSFVAPSLETDAAFGHAVAICKNVVVVGAPRSDKGGRDAGSVFIFERTGEDWTLSAQLVAPDASTADFFGSTVALDGNHLAVGAWGDDDHGQKTGSVWCYEKKNGLWSMRQKIVPDRLQARDLFGTKVLFHQHELMISAPGTCDDRGAVYVFTGRTGRWELIDRVTDPSSETGDRFGQSMAASKGLLVIGAPEAGEGSTSNGRITIYQRSGWGWSLLDRHTVLPITNEQPIRFGFNVSIDEGSILVGRSDQADEEPLSSGAWLLDDGVAALTTKTTTKQSVSSR